MGIVTLDMTAPFTSDDLASLGAKLDALDLTPGEAAALDALADAAGPDPEVAGYVAASSVAPGGYRDRLAGSFDLGLTAPGVKVRGLTQQGSVNGI